MSAVRAVARPFMSVAAWYTRCAKSHPLATAIWTSGIKTSAADLFAQKVVEGRDEIDLKRHALFCMFGFGYLGCFQYWLYNIKFVQWCMPISNSVGHTATAPVKVFLDQCIHHPLLYFPVFYSLKAAVEGKPPSYALEKYESEIWESCKALWSVWVPSQLVNFAFVPRHFRVPWVAMTSFVWCIVLSVMQGQFDAERDGANQPGAEHLEAHYAAMQVMHSDMKPLAATPNEVFPPAEALTPPAVSPSSPANTLLPPTAVVAAEGSTKPQTKAHSVLERRPHAYSFHPFSMAVRVAMGVTR